MDWLKNQTWILDGNDVSDRASLHAHLKEAMNLPEYYGGNLDALYDCLSEVTGTLYVYHTAAIRRNLGAYAERFLTVLKDSDSEYFHAVVTD